MTTKMKMTSKMNTTLKNEDDLKNEDNLKNEDDLKNKDNLKTKDDLKNEDDHRSPLSLLHFQGGGGFGFSNIYQNQMALTCIQKQNIQKIFKKFGGVPLFRPLKK